VKTTTVNKNTILLWTIGTLPPSGTALLTVYVSGQIKNSPSECGKVKTLNGSWSALFATTPGGTLTKSQYNTDVDPNDVATLTVTCP
jgi:hypothetical protein